MKIPVYKDGKKIGEIEVLPKPELTEEQIIKALDKWIEKHKKKKRRVKKNAYQKNSRNKRTSTRIS